MSTERTHIYAEEEPEPSELVGEAFDQLGSNWRLKVLYALHEHGELRFNELKRTTDASSRTLSRVVEDLQEYGLVERRLEEDAPVATYYSETQKAEDLCPVFSALDEWADEWVETV
ncbi:helix-turn-helix domain-containing protein [Haloarculaceae archaeon H-GB2-1]|nr:helix-turn-helix domain-containing protein [Haloarculaceae archaeon H-GB1-1]MEA5389054.1 helix-turn-helix domain-containing protein [Haloarculaceae archaeon H-GB11]MEA5407115.1 helix-turn-helix domain-containing protein [Haloarculaceae archaeon H-GB2-1]